MADQKVGIEIVARDAASATIAKVRGEVHSLKGGMDGLREKILGVTSAMGTNNNAVAAISRSLGALGPSAGVAAAGIGALATALVLGAKSAANYQEKLDMAAEATGFTTEELVGLKIAASESGRSFEQLRPSLDKFTREIAEAARGSEEAVATFHTLGVGVKDSAGNIRPSGDVLREVQAALRAMPEPAERARIAMELFGRSGAASLSALLQPMDENIQKGKDLGLILGDEAKAAAQKADLAFDALGTSLEAVKVTFGALSAEILGPFLTALAKASLETAKFFASLDDNAIGRKLKQDYAKATATTPAGSPVSPAGAERSTRGELAAMTHTTGVVVELKKSIDRLSQEMEKYRQKEFTKALDSMLGVNPMLRGAPTLTDEKPFSQALAEAKEGQERLTYQMNESAAAADALTKGMEDWGEIGENAIQNLQSGFGSMISDMLHGVGNLGQAFSNMILEIAAQAAAAAATKGFLSLIGLQGGGTMAMQTGGTVTQYPLKAQSGLVVAGMRGMDTVPALVGRGETIISHALTDRLSAFIGRMDTMTSAMGSQRPSSGSPISVNLSYSGSQGGFERDRLALNQWLRDDVMPELRRVAQKGSRA